MIAALLRCCVENSLALGLLRFVVFPLLAHILMFYG